TSSMRCSAASTMRSRESTAVRGRPAPRLAVVVPIPAVGIARADIKRIIFVRVLWSTGAKMRVGIPNEVKVHEYRVAITPIGVHELVAHGHEVFVDSGPGLGSAT